MKETVDKEIFLTSKNGDRKIMEFIGLTSRPPPRIREWDQFEPVQMNIYQVISLKKELKLKTATYQL